jgi:hypothetical protein
VVAHPATLRVRKDHRVKLKIAVSDAGSPVAHATVTVAGQHTHTSADGTASVRVGPFARRTTIHVAAAHAGYAAGAVTVRVGLR